jgi:hypothetical protein
MEPRRTSRPGLSRAGRGARGSLLLDALVALAILAGSVGAAAGATAGALRVARKLSDAVGAQLRSSTASAEAFHARATYR